MYTITDYTKKRADDLGVSVTVSNRKGKKIEVIDPETLETLAHVGAIGYGDYPTYIKTHGKEFADKKRKAFRARTASMPMWRILRNKKVRSPAYWARELLW
jgi:hypothetical protein